MPVPKEKFPFIAFHFEGIVALCVAQNKHGFDAGIIKAKDHDDEIEDHIHSITLTKLVNGKPMEPITIVNTEMRAKLVNLVINDPKHADGTGIAFHKESSGPDSLNRDVAYDFGWVLDVEGKEMHDDKAVELKKKSLRTVLQVSGIAKGIFFTGHVGEGFTSIKDENVSTTRHMRTAESVKALVPLPADARLSWFDESTGFPREILLEASPNVSYEINVLNSCKLLKCKVDIAKHYNDLFSPKGDKRFSFVDSSKVDFSDSIELLFSPETICTIPNFSKSLNLPVDTE